MRLFFIFLRFRFGFFYAFLSVAEDIFEWFDRATDQIDGVVPGNAFVLGELECADDDCAENHGKHNNDECA